MAFKLGSKSLANLVGVHPDLVKVVKRAIELTPVDFTVFEGVRTLARQKQLLARKATKTLRSRHIPQSNKCNLGCAVDLVPLKDGKVTWANKDIKPLYLPMRKAVLDAAKELGVSIRWGGDWDMDGEWTDEKFFDGPHFELYSGVYPYA